MEFMLTILIGEGRLDKDDMKIGLLAALFHDAAQGLSRLPKITEKNIKDRCLELACGAIKPDDFEKYLKDAVTAREEHMKDGAKIAESKLLAHQKQHPDEIKDEHIRRIVGIIAQHDNPKFPIIFDVARTMFESNKVCIRWHDMSPESDAKKLRSLFSCERAAGYLIKPDDWLLQYHHEADLLWMVTQDGIDADLARFSPAEDNTPRQLLDNNMTEHQREATLCERLAPDAGYSFQGGYAYRSKTGYALFQYLTRLLDERFPRQSR